jgi:hypothetical protein
MKNPVLMKSMKFLTYSLLIVLSAILYSGCTKEDIEAERKEALTRTLIGDIKADSLRTYVQWLQDMGTRFALANNRRNVAVNIRKKFESFGYTDVKLDSFGISVTYKGVSYIKLQYNVIATLETDTESDSVCIMGGHYDSIIGSGDPFSTAPGANDNASGVAAALEVARVMKKNNFIPANTIRFVAFGAEELGLFGSKHYSDNALHTLERIKLMLNNDMIAYETVTDMTNWAVNIIDYKNSHYLRKEAEQLCHKYTVLYPYNNNTYSNASDSYPFSLNGYKALFFFSDKLDPKYHSTGDVVSNCNFEYSAEIVKLNCAILVFKN